MSDAEIAVDQMVIVEKPKKECDSLNEMKWKEMKDNQIEVQIKLQTN